MDNRKKQPCEETQQRDCRVAEFILGVVEEFLAMTNNGPGFLGARSESPCTLTPANKCSSVLSVRANDGKPLYIRQKPAFQAIKSRSLKCSQVFAKCSPRGLRPFRVRQPLHLSVTSVTSVTRPTEKPEIQGKNGSRHFPCRKFLSVTKRHYVSPNSGGGFGRCYIEKKRSMRSMRSGKWK